MRCSSSESGTSLPPVVVDAPSPKESRTGTWGQQREARWFCSSRPVRAVGRPPLLIAASLDPDAVWSSERRRHDGLVTEAVPNVVDCPAGIVPSGLEAGVESQLPSTLVDEVADGHAEEPYARRGIHGVEQVL